MASPYAVLLCLMLLSRVGVDSCRWHHSEGSGLHLDCSKRHLTAIPTDNLNASVTELDLSFNNLDSIPAYAFNNCLDLHYLNLSTSGIRDIDKDAFAGMARLTILDVTNNWFLSSNIPENLLDDCVSLRQLFIAGDSFDTKFIAVLSNLEEIVLSSSSEHFPYPLVNLTKLRMITFWFGVSGTRLTRRLIAPLSAMNIEELAFVHCSLEHIDNGTFSDFTSLQVLNFAGNPRLHIDDVINAISTSDGVELEGLVLDLMNYRNPRSYIAGVLDYPTCRRAWLSLEDLSLRAVDLFVFLPHMAKCLPKLKTIAFGLNMPHSVGVRAVPLLRLFDHLKSVDASYFGVLDVSDITSSSGGRRNLGWIPRNTDYFSPLYPNSSKSLVNSQSKSCKILSKCKVVFIPFMLEYFKFDHVLFLRGGLPDVECVQITSNNLRYINVSTIYTNAMYTLNAVVLGLETLEVFDMTRASVDYMNLATLCYMPSLRVLMMGGNLLGTRDFDPLPYAPQLQHLDLSDNLIHELSKNTFANLPGLLYLNVAGNSLSTADFIGYNLKTLQHLDLSKNKIASISIYITKKLEKMFGDEPDFTLDLSDNPLQCDCHEADFIAWMQTTRVHIKNKEKLTCTLSNVLIADVNVGQLRTSCGLTVNKLVVSTVSMALVILVSALSGIIYRFRWSLKWRVYKLRYGEGPKRDSVLMENLNGSGKYSTYVIYPYDDDETREWVYGTLRPLVENEWQKPAMYLVGRDDIGGETNINNLVRGIMRSHTAIWVVCPAFLKDRHCETAANFAFEELGAGNNIMLIMETRFDQYFRPGVFASLMNPKIGLTRLRYTDSENGRQLFWAKLESFIPAWSH